MDYNEKISCLYAVSENDSPIAYLTADGFPVTQSLELKCIFFNLKVSKIYTVTTTILTDGQIVSRTQNIFRVEESSLDMPPIDNIGSTMVSIQTPSVIFQANKIYQVNLDIRDEEGSFLHENSTYIRTIIDGG